MPETKLRLARKNPVCTRFVFVDGLARAGKALALRTLSYMTGGDHWQYSVVIEQTSYLVFLGGIDEAVAAPFVQFMVEEQAYNRMIGRCLNTRGEDTSSIFHSPDHGEYIRRAVSRSGMEAVDKFNDAGRFQTFDLHNVMASGPFIFKALPEAQVVHICRHPVDQIYKWHQRKWGSREMEDPLSFVPIVETPEGLVPWFAKDWAGRYLSANPMERALDSVLFLQEADEKGFSRLSEEERKNVHWITLERLATDPEPVVAEIAAFLKSEPHEHMKLMLLEERVPRILDPADRTLMFREISEGVSNSRVERLVDASRRFEVRWDMEGFKP